MSLHLRIALRYLISSRGSTLLITLIAFLGVFLGVCAILLTVGVFTGFQDSLRDKILANTPHIIVSILAEEDKERIKKVIKGTEGVIRAVPFVIYSGVLSYEGRIQPVTVKAVDYKDRDFRDMIKKHLKEGSLEGLVLGEGIAESLGVRVNDIVFLVSPTGIRTPTGFIPKTRRMRVGGIFATGTYDKDFVLVFMDVREARRFFKRGFSLEGIDVYVRDPYRVQEVKERLERSLKDDLIIVRSWIDLNKPLFNALQLEKLALFLILLLMVLIASFNITSLLFVKTKERTKDIAILKTFGMARGDILRIFLTVGLSIGTAGALTGTLVAFVAAYFINEYKLIRVPEEVYMMSYIPVHIKPKDAVMTFGGTLILSFIASLIPSVRASRENIVSILRNE